MLMSQLQPLVSHQLFAFNVLNIHDLRSTKLMLPSELFMALLPFNNQLPHCRRQYLCSFTHHRHHPHHRSVVTIAARPSPHGLSWTSGHVTMLSSGVGSCFQGFRIRFRLTRRLATFAPTRRRCHVATDAGHKVVT